MDGDGWEVLFRQELSQGNAALDRLDEDHNLKMKIRQKYYCVEYQKYPRRHRYYNNLVFSFITIKKDNRLK